MSDDGKIKEVIDRVFLQAQIKAQNEMIVMLRGLMAKCRIASSGVMALAIFIYITPRILALSILAFLFVVCMLVMLALKLHIVSNSKKLRKMSVERAIMNVHD